MPDDGKQEIWPIPIEPIQMNPRFLLGYATERIIINSGERVFRHFVHCFLSRELYIHVYWYMHCVFFQDDSKEEQEHLLNKISSVYVSFLELKKLANYKDFF